MSLKKHTRKTKEKMREARRAFWANSANRKRIINARWGKEKGIKGFIKRLFR